MRREHFQRLPADAATPGVPAGTLPGERLELRFRIDDAPTTARPTTRPATDTKKTEPKKTAPTRDPEPTQGLTDGSKPDDKPATDSSPRVDGRRPSGGATGASRGGGMTRPRTVDRGEPDPVGGSGAGGAEGPSRTESRGHAPEETRARDLERERQRSAGVLDSALSPEEIARLRKEQDAFFGTQAPTQKPGRGGVGGAAGGTKAGGAAGPPAPPPSSTDGRRGPGESLDGADGDKQGDKGGGSLPPVPASLPTAVPAGPTHEEQMAFFQDREYWIAPDGEVWRVEVLGDETVHLARHDDADGSVGAGLSPANVSVGPPAGGPVGSVGGMPPVTPGAPKPKSGDGADEVDGHDGHDDDHHEWESQQLDAADPQARFDEAIGVGGPVQTEPPGGLPESTVASGDVYLLPDGRFVSATDVDMHWADGSTRRAINRQSQGPEREQYGLETMVLDRTRREDGSSVELRRTSSIGLYASEDEQPTGGVLGKIARVFGEMPQHERTQVTITDADGRRVSTDSDRPSPRETPTTLDELRAAQDELGLAWEAAQRPELPGDASRADVVLADATYAMADVDRMEIERAVHDGAREIARTDPDQVTQFADEEFGDVRAAFDRWGLDAADGNALIDREWLDEELRGNAYYDRRADNMVFGVGADGTPFAMGSDVIAHEFTHRVINSNGGIDYEGESGAINESLADTMASALDDDWILGEDIVEDGVRDMSRRVTMDDWLETERDHGGVHTNSAIPNHAAYLIGESVGREQMGAIYARTIDEHTSPDMDFRDLARGTYQAAQELYGRDSAEVRAVRQAWEGVLLIDDGSLWTGLDGAGSGGGRGASGSW